MFQEKYDLKIVFTKHILTAKTERGWKRLSRNSLDFFKPLQLYVIVQNNH